MNVARGSARAAQQGGFLLEALVGILIFSLGVLGLVGLQARSIGYVSDAQYRGEAANLANSYLGRMWADKPSNLPALYESPGQPAFDAFRQAVYRLPGASSIANNPSVTIVQPPAGAAMDQATSCALAGLSAGCGLSLTPRSSIVTITIQWMPAAVEAGSADITRGGMRVPHNYSVTTVLGSNS